MTQAQLEKLSDILFDASKILSKVVKEKQAPISEDIISNLSQAKDDVRDAQYIYDTFDDKIIYDENDWEFLKQDLDFILITDFYFKVSNLKDNVYNTFSEIGKRLLEF